MSQQTGKYIIIAGLVITLIGILVFFFHNAFRWFGRLPGDIRVEGKNTRFYFPWGDDAGHQLSVDIIDQFIPALVLNLRYGGFRQTKFNCQKDLGRE